MKIISWNVNGLRAVYKRNFRDWLMKTDADFVCLQEVKVDIHQVPSDLINPAGYFSYFNFGIHKGHSGVAVFTKEKPKEIKKVIGFKRLDQEGRVLILRYKKFTLFNLYLPHGGRQKENLPYKLEVYDYLIDYLGKIKNEKIILAGDFNVAHKEIDLARPKENVNNIMFTPEERKQIDRLISLGFIDTFRKLHPEGGHYTWWVYPINNRERKDVGWRIDCLFVSKNLTSRLKKAVILSEVTGSDHCPIGIIV